MDKNKGKNLVLILLFLLLIINIAMMITFFFFPKKEIDEKRAIRKFHPHKHMECLIESLELTEEQELKFFELRDSHKKKIFNLIDSTRTIRHHMLDELSNYNSLDSSVLYTYPEKISKMEELIQIETIDYFLRTRKILNETQYKELINNFKNVCGCKKKHKKPAYNHSNCKHKSNK